ncbi:MAG: TIGR03016 family PEP-CTERM system-associated outer membrane protein [Gammaproteobacteria bacterium]|nr:TIGR03016 family PEP-CTERM system-associated outer membrane protein [Gammaproteobacteria bacterium]
MTFRTLLLIFATLPVPAYTANLTITPSITTSLAYTNNLFLNPAIQKESDFIAEINPALNLARIGKRLNLSLNYRMQNTAFQKNSDSNNTKHQIQTSARAEIVNQKFFVNLSGNFSQRNTSIRGIRDSLNLAPLSNTTDVVNYVINPYLIHRFNTFAESRISYIHATTDFNNNDNNDNNDDNNTILSDSQNQELEARLSSGTRFIRWQWNLLYQYRTEERDNINTISTQLQRFLFDARTPLDALDSFTPLARLNNTRLILKAGYESNDYDISVIDETQTSGAEWGIGISWSPSIRSTIELTAGQRYYGSTYQFLMTHSGRKMNFDLDYIEEITTSNSIQRNDRVFDNEIIPSTNFNTVLNKELTGELEFNRRKLAGTLLLSLARRENVQNRQTEDNYRLSPAATLTLNPRSSVTARVELIQQKFGQNRKDVRFEFSSIMNHRLSRKIDTTLTYSYLDQNSNISAFAYNRHLIAIALSMTF